MATIRGLTRNEIRRQAMKHKYAFIGTFYDNHTVAGSCQIVGVFAAQIYRWRDSDQKFDAAVTAIESIKNGVTDEEHSELIGYLQAYIAQLGAEIKAIKRQRPL